MTLLGQPTSWLEIIAALSGIAGVWLTIRRSKACFPVGMISVALYVVIFLDTDVRLYADALLQVCFFLLLGYGWSTWKNTGEEKAVTPESMTGREWRTATPIVIVSAMLMGWLFKHYTEASLPWLDATLTSISLCAQWMIAKKKIENWWLWTGVNAIYVPMYLYKGLSLTAVLYLIFLIMAIAGWRNWKRNAGAIPS